MAENMKQLLYQYSKDIAGVYGKHLKAVILYGSYARGDFNDSSDIDIKPIAKNEEHFMRWISAYPFYANVNWEGVKLYGAE